MKTAETVKPMFNPPHPGEVIQATYLDALGISIRSLAKSLEVSPSTLARIVSGDASVTPEMAIRLEAVLSRSAQMWLRLQENYDLWHARQTVNTQGLQPLPELIAA